jgi:hypothetical protein
MKKIILSIALMTLGTGAFAQYSNSYFGVKLGLNASHLVNPDGFYEGLDVSHRNGFAGGIYYNMGFGDRFSIQPELLYSSMGTNFATKSNINPSFDRDLKLDYLSVPVLLKYNPTWRLGLFAGPQFDFLLNSDLENLAKKASAEPTNLNKEVEKKPENTKPLTKADMIMNQLKGK